MGAVCAGTLEPETEPALGPAVVADSDGLDWVPWGDGLALKAVADSEAGPIPKLVSAPARTPIRPTGEPFAPFVEFEPSSGAPDVTLVGSVEFTLLLAETMAPSVVVTTTFTA